MDLNENEKKFLRSHGLSEQDVFDGTQHATTASAVEEARRQEKTVVYRKCSKGHSFYTLSEHCCGCSLNSLKRYLQYRAPGYIYVAVSKEKELLKVGVANDIEDRQKSLNSAKDSSVKDWTVVMHLYMEKDSGRIEKEIQENLGFWGAADQYNKTGKTEVFTCSLKTLNDVIAQVFKYEDIKPIKFWQHPKVLEFNIPDKEGKKYVPSGNRR